MSDTIVIAPETPVEAPEVTPEVAMVVGQTAAELDTLEDEVAEVAASTEVALYTAEEAQLIATESVAASTLVIELLQKVVTYQEATMEGIKMLAVGIGELNRPVEPEPEPPKRSTKPKQKHWLYRERKS